MSVVIAAVAVSLLTVWFSTALAEPLKFASPWYVAVR